MLTAMRNLLNSANVATAAHLEVEYPSTEVSGIKTTYLIDADCERFLAQYAEARRERMKQEFASSFLKPHRNSGYRLSGEICVLLTKTDISRGHFGFHNYYRMELIKRKGSELYILFTNWGRIGDQTGQYQRTPFSNLDEADKEFSSIFRSKTGNEFANINAFDEKPAKYSGGFERGRWIGVPATTLSSQSVLFRIVKVDSENAGNIAELDIDFDKSVAIDQEAAKTPLYGVIKDISNVRRLQERTRTVCQYQRSRVPFGCIFRSDLLQAQKVLAKLRDLKKEMEQCRMVSRGPDATLAILREQSKTTDEFYR
ncbi:unnamed protein product [Gongylonema pulchrum]|uniref:PARP alpha-helical domain-containing protein n=1 Tax=Gongylonema pulchrum TaxID=637853 RepID=A0A183EH70_9BILA|nr:unnamed protein product [Gongylonema pulchrum]